MPFGCDAFSTTPHPGCTVVLLHTTLGSILKIHKWAQQLNDMRAAAYATHFLLRILPCHLNDASAPKRPRGQPFQNILLVKPQLLDVNFPARGQLMAMQDGRSEHVKNYRVGLKKCGRKWVRGQAKRILPKGPCQPKEYERKFRNRV